MKGSRILITGAPKGRFFEGPLSTSGTPKPGTVMQIKAATAIDGNGHFTFTEYDQAADGNRPGGPILVLLEKGEGYIYSDAYADEDHCFVYCPLPGDELNMLVAASGTATSDSQAIGAKYMVDDGTGLLIAESSPEAEPFVCLETQADVVSTGTLTHCMFSGY